MFISFKVCRPIGFGSACDSNQNSVLVPNFRGIYKLRKLSHFIFEWFCTYKRGLISYQEPCGSLTSSISLYVDDLDLNLRPLFVVTSNNQMENKWNLKGKKKKIESIATLEKFLGFEKGDILCIENATKCRTVG